MSKRAAHADQLSAGGQLFRTVKTLSARQVLRHEAGETVIVRLDGHFREDVRKTQKRDGSGEGEAKHLLVEVTEMKSGLHYDYPVTVQTRKAITDNYAGDDYIGRIFAIEKEAVGEGKGVRYATTISEVEPE